MITPENPNGGVMDPRPTFNERLEKDISNILLKNCDPVILKEINRKTYAIKDLEGLMYELLSYIEPLYQDARKYKDLQN